MNSHLATTFALLLLVPCVSAEYKCLCSYQVETQIYEKPDTSSKIDDYMYEFDCKPVYDVDGLDFNYVAVGNNNKLGYILLNSQDQVQICQGQISIKDFVSTTVPPSTTTTTTTTTTTAPTTTTTMPTTTSPLTTTSAMKPTTTSSMPSSSSSSTSSSVTPQPPVPTKTPTTSKFTLKPPTKPITTSTVSSSAATPSSTTTATTTKTTTVPSSSATTPLQSSATTPLQTTPTTVKTTTVPSSTTTTPSPTTPPTTVKTTTTPLTTLSTTSRPVGCPPSSKPSDTVSSSAYCYELVRPQETWLDAKKACEWKNGTLVTIETQIEQDFIYNMLKTLRFYDVIWLGLHDRIGEEDWQWVTGTKMVYDNWMLSRYIDRFHHQEDCGVFVYDRNGQWDDTYCEGLVYERYMTYSYICQYKISP